MSFIDSLASSSIWANPFFLSARFFDAVSADWLCLAEFTRLVSGERPSFTASANVCAWTPPPSTNDIIRVEIVFFVILFLAQRILNGIQDPYVPSAPYICNLRKDNNKVEKQQLCCIYFIKINSRKRAAKERLSLEARIIITVLPLFL